MLKVRKSRARAKRIVMAGRAQLARRRACTMPSVCMAGNVRRWSAQVMRTSNALDLEPGVFTKHSARAIAQSLKQSAERSRRRKGEPFRSAMSMLTFYLNRSGKGLPEAQRQVLERAKGELRKLYRREDPAGTAQRPAARRAHPRSRAPGRDV